MIKNNIFFRKLRFGFTLTEVLIVVVIVGILSTLALPMVVKTLEKAKIGEATSNLNLIRTGEKIYFLEYATYASDILSLNIEDPNTNAKYFNYGIEAADANDFTARAQRKDDAPGDYKKVYYEITENGNITTGAI